jgi:hypothetical protein
MKKWHVTVGLTLGTVKLDRERREEVGRRFDDTWHNPIRNTLSVSLWNIDTTLLRSDMSTASKMLTLTIMSMDEIRTNLLLCGITDNSVDVTKVEMWWTDAEDEVRKQAWLDDGGTA